MLNTLMVHLRFKADTYEKEIVFNSDYIHEDLSIQFHMVQNKTHNRLQVLFLPNKPIEIKELYIQMPYTYQKEHVIFMNGYQSWTDSREYSIDDKMVDMSFLARKLNSKYHFTQYGDYTFQSYSHRRGALHGYTFMYVREEDTLDFMGSLNESSGFTIFETHVRKNSLRIRKDNEGLIIQKEYIPFDLVFAKGSMDTVFDTYFNEMNLKHVSKDKITGFTTWYHYYQNINEPIILKTLNAFKTPLDLYQIDDGYQKSVGDWLSIDPHKFPNGLKPLVQLIKDKNMKPGLWLAPFVCETNSEIFKTKPDWILKDNEGKLVVAGVNWSGFYALDFYNLEVQTYIKHVFDVILNDWGFELVKLDFLYAACLIPLENKTRGQIMTEAMDFLRECVGDKLILGCGVPLGPAFGRVDYCRIGCDVGLNWDDCFYMRWIHRERVSTYHAIQNTIYRHPLNNRAFQNDPDVFLLREGLALTANQKETLGIVNHVLGSVLFTSDDVSHYDTSKKQLFNEIMKKTAIKVISIRTLKNKCIEILYEEEQLQKGLIVNLSHRHKKVGLETIEPYQTLRIGATNELTTEVFKKH